MHHLCKLSRHVLPRDPACLEHVVAAVCSSLSWAFDSKIGDLDEEIDQVQNMTLHQTLLE